MGSMRDFFGEISSPSSMAGEEADQRSYLSAFRIDDSN
jgi:hypothetical protein